MNSLKVTLKNAPIKTFPVELSLPDCYKVAAKLGSSFQKITADEGKVIVLVDNPKTGALVMYHHHKDTLFQILPPASVIRDSDKNIKYVLLNDDVPHVQCDGKRMDFEREED